MKIRFSLEVGEGGCTFKKSANCSSSLYRLNKTRMNLSRCWFWLILISSVSARYKWDRLGNDCCWSCPKNSDQGKQFGLPQWMPWNDLGSKSTWTVLFPLTELNRKVVVLFTTMTIRILFWYLWSLMSSRSDMLQEKQVLLGGRSNYAKNTNVPIWTCSLNFLC